jgi:flagellar biosynthetic protein FliR
LIEVSGLQDVLSSLNLTHITLVFVRVSAITFLIPGLSASYIPARYKLALAAIITASISGNIYQASSAQVLLYEPFWRDLIREVLYGLAVGITLRTGIFTLQIAGAIIAQSSSIAQIFGGSVSQDAQSTVSNILTISGIALLMATGFLTNLLTFLLQTYEWAPLSYPVERESLLTLTLEHISAGYVLAFQISMPFLALSLFYNITLGAINRAMPQLLVSFVGAPAIIAASIAMLVVSIETILDEWANTSFGALAIPGLL